MHWLPSLIAMLLPTTHGVTKQKKLSCVDMIKNMCKSKFPEESGANIISNCWFQNQRFAMKKENTFLLLLRFYE
jgi:hypothetical protein